MAEFDDIEYEGVGGNGEIAVRSDRCFRDYSPGDTVLSLSDDEHALYSCPVPSFADPPHIHAEPNVSPRRSQTQSSYGAATEGEAPNSSSVLSHRALVEMQRCIPPYSEDELSPLARFRRDIQVHERLALGIEPGEFGLLPELGGSPQRPRAENGKMRQSQSSMISSLHLSPSPSPIEAETSSAAEQLRELLGVIGSPGWEDDISPEEQAEHLRRVTRLKRRVGSDMNPRAVKVTKVRKRDHQNTSSSKGQRSLSS